MDSFEAIQNTNLHVWVENGSYSAYIYRVVKKMAQLLVGHNFKTARKNPTKLHTTIFQHVFNHFVNFQSKWTKNVQIAVALKLGVQ